MCVPEGNSRPYLAAVSKEAMAARILMPSSSTPTTETVMSALITNPLSRTASITSIRVPARSLVGSMYCVANFNSSPSAKDGEWTMEDGEQKMEDGSNFQLPISNF